MADNGGQYDSKAQAMEEAHFDWRCIVCCMVALSPLHLEQQHLPGTDSVYFDLDNTPWVKCDKCHSPFHLQCATWESLQIAHSFVVGSFRYPFYFLDLCRLFLVFLVQSFKMARRKRCPDGGEKKKKETDDDKSKRHGEGSGRTMLAIK